MRKMGYKTLVCAFQEIRYRFCQVWTALCWWWCVLVGIAIFVVYNSVLCFLPHHTRQINHISSLLSSILAVFLIAVTLYKRWTIVRQESPVSTLLNQLKATFLESRNKLNSLVNPMTLEDSVSVDRGDTIEARLTSLEVRIKELDEKTDREINAFRQRVDELNKELGWLIKALDELFVGRCEINILLLTGGLMAFAAYAEFMATFNR